MENFTTEAAALSAARNFASSFAVDPITRWLLNPVPGLLGGKPKSNLIHEYTFRLAFFSVAQLMAVRSGVVISNVDGDWACAGACAPPEVNWEGTVSAHLRSWKPIIEIAWKLGWARTWKVTIQYPSILTAVKQSAFTSSRLRNRDYYYIFIIGTLESARGRGLATTYVQRCQETARKHGKPVWLETGSEKARRLYMRLGFTETMDVRIGEGFVNEEGWGTSEGQEAEGSDASGVRLWGLVWWPECHMEEEEQKHRVEEETTAKRKWRYW